MLQHRGALVLTCLALALGAPSWRDVAAQAPSVSGPAGGPGNKTAASRSAPRIAELAEPMLRLGGLRINPRTNGPHRNAAVSGITLKTIATGASRTVAGAFMTANLLAHSDLFRMGIARSGAYNRTLTPSRTPTRGGSRCSTP
jgi:hypothetical protein